MRVQEARRRPEPWRWWVRGGGELLMLAWSDGRGGLGWGTPRLVKLGTYWKRKRGGTAPSRWWGPEISPQPHLPPDFAQCQFDVWELLPEGLIHVLLEVGGLHVLYYGGLRERRPQGRGSACAALGAQPPEPRGADFTPAWVCKWLQVADQRI